MTAAFRVEQKEKKKKKKKKKPGARFRLRLKTSRCRGSWADFAGKQRHKESSE
ncbi:uncharacterized protein V6R79_016253 [Siganus canaliculatus]